MEHLDKVYGGRGEGDVKDVEEEEVFRGESAAQGPIIDGGFKESLGWEAI